MTKWHYLDTSAWAKRYLAENGAAVVREVFRTQHQLACSVLGHIEIVATIARRSRSVGDIRWDEPMQSVVDSDWISFVQLEATPQIWDQASRLAGSFGLRAADAVHLASAAELKAQLRATADLTFVSSDFELNQAARALGLRVLDPAQQDG